MFGRIGAQTAIRMSGAGGEIGQLLSFTPARIMYSRRVDGEKPPIFRQVLRQCFKPFGFRPKAKANMRVFEILKQHRIFNFIIRSDNNRD